MRADDAQADHLIADDRSPGRLDHVASLAARAWALPLRRVLPSAAGYVRRQAVNAWQRRADAVASTYLATDAAIVEQPLLLHFPLPAVEALRSHAERITALAGLYVEHRFDYLGSGWVRIEHGMRCPGMEGYRYSTPRAVAVDPAGEWLDALISPGNRAESRRIWSQIDVAYRPIDWQIDFKSGYRWSESTWSRDVPHGHLPGVDIKLPWELGRMQHLPQLALASLLATREPALSGPHDADVYRREFRNQVLDFIASNPPRFGVQWRSTMDVAIRVANLLVARDLFLRAGAVFDDAFEAIFRRSVVEHALHIGQNLEWSDQPRGNHYLAHITGLLFAAAYLPPSPRVDAWLALAIQELGIEGLRQFHPDGSNFEASTSYHRLSAEMVVYSVALTIGLPEDKLLALTRYDHAIGPGRPALRNAPLPTWPLAPGLVSPIPPALIERLERAAEFTMHVTRPDARIAQFGDNDSGRFLRLIPNHVRRTVREARTRYANLRDYTELADAADFWDEDVLDHRHLVAAVNGLFSRPDFEDFAQEPAEQRLVRGLSGERTLASYHEAVSQEHGRSQVRIVTADPVRCPEGAVEDRYSHYFRAGAGDLTRGLERHAYPQFGLFVYRSPRLFLAVRCGSIGQEGRGGHAHNDQLSLELMVDGEPLVSDPGSYLYTALPRVRNAYRSDRAHFGFVAEDRESAGLRSGLFALDSDPSARCLLFDELRFIGTHMGFGCRVIRSVLLEPGGVRINDLVCGSGSSAGAVPAYARTAAGTDNRAAVAYSPGYGKVVAET